MKAAGSSGTYTEHLLLESEPLFPLLKYNPLVESQVPSAKVVTGAKDATVIIVIINMYIFNKFLMVFIVQNLY
jgi:hypothetical protein